MNQRDEAEMQSACRLFGQNEIQSGWQAGRTMQRCGELRLIGNEPRSGEFKNDDTSWAERRPAGAGLGPADVAVAASRKKIIKNNTAETNNESPFRCENQPAWSAPHLDFFPSPVA